MTAPAWPVSDSRDVAADLDGLDVMIAGAQAGAEQHLAGRQIRSLHPEERSAFGLRDAEVHALQSVRRAVAVLGAQLAATCADCQPLATGCRVHAEPLALLREYRLAIARLGGAR